MPGMPASRLKPRRALRMEKLGAQLWPTEKLSVDEIHLRLFHRVMIRRYQRMEARLLQKLSKQESQPLLADLKRVQRLLKVMDKAGKIFPFKWGS